MRKYILFLLIAFVSSAGYAVTIDTIQITVTAVFALSVNISSATQTFGFSVANRSSVTICACNIVNDGNIASKWQKMSAISAGSAGTPWSLKTSGTPATDEFRLLAMSTGTATPPNYCGGGTQSDSCIEGDHSTLGVTTTLTDLTEGGAGSPIHSPGETKKLWISLMMPYDITTGAEQTMTLSVIAAVP